MNKRPFLFLFAFALIAVLIAPPARAEGLATDSDMGYTEFYGKLPESLTDLLPSGSSSSPEDAAAALTDWNFLISAFLGEAGRQLTSILPSFFLMLGLILVAALINSVKSSLEKRTAHVISVCSNAVTAAAVASMQVKIVFTAGSYIDDLLTLSRAASPVIVTLYAASGSPSSATVSASAMSIFLAFSENVIGSTVVPVSGILLMLTLVSAASPELGINGFIDLIRRMYTGVVSFMMTLLCAVLAGQKVIAAGNDSITLRAAKFFAGSTIPVIGRSVGETLRTVSGSVALIRGCFGVCGVIMMILLMLPTALMLIVDRAAIGFVSAAAELLGCSTEARLLDGISGVIGSILAVMIGCSLMFIFAVALLCIGIMGVQ